MPRDCTAQPFVEPVSHWVSMMNSPTTGVVSHTSRSRLPLISSRMTKSKKKNSAFTKKPNKATSKPSAKSEKIAIPMARFSSQRGQVANSIRIAHTEYVGKVSGQADGSFVCQYAEVNPGLYPTFPWLSGLAHNFESYKFRSLSFKYVPFCPVTTQGCVSMAFDYDVDDYAPTTKGQMMSYQGAVSGPVWDSLELNCESLNLKKFALDRYIRSGSIANTDAKTYDIGFLNFAADHTTDGSSKGDIYVSYDVELITPQVQEDDDAKNSACLSSTACTKAAPLLNAQLEADVNDPIAAFDSVDSSININKPGSWLLTFAGVGTGLNGTGLVFTDMLSAVAPVFTNVAINTFNAAATNAVQQWVVDCKSPAKFSVASAAAWTTLTSMSIRLAPYLWSYY